MSTGFVLGKDVLSVPGKDRNSESEYVQLFNTTWCPQCHKFCYLFPTVLAKRKKVIVGKK